MLPQSSSTGKFSSLPEEKDDGTEMFETAEGKDGETDDATDTMGAAAFVSASGRRSIMSLVLRRRGG